MTFQEIRHFPGGPGEMLEPDGHGPQPPDQEPGIKGLDTGTGVHEFTVEDLFHHLPCSGQDASDGVAMTPDVLCSRLHGDVDTQGDGSLVQGAAIAVVDDRDDVLRTGQFRYRLQVLQLKIPGIGGFQVDEGRIGKDGPFEVFDAGPVDIGGSHAKTRKDDVEHPLRPGIGFVDGYDMVAGLYVGQDTGKDGTRPAVEDQGFFGAVQRRELFTEDLDGRVETPAIQIAAVFVVEKRFQLVDGIDAEIAGLYDGRGYGVEVFFSLFPEFVYDVRDVHSS